MEQPLAGLSSSGVERKKQLILLGLIPVVAVGWFLFRPELLFVNQSVSEKLPVSQSSKAIKELSKGSFTSYAHETKGSASLVEADGKTYLRLSDFSTSNGPDVHVYLVKGSDASQAGVNKAGFLDLGVIKGNIGDQNYEIPAGTNLSEYGGASIWCKRFAVAFAGATLTPTKPVSQLSNSGWSLAGFSDITVTKGALKSGSQNFGTVAIVETSGKRFLSLNGLKGIRAKTRVVLVKSEELHDAKTLAASEKVNAGSLNGKQKTAQFSISGELDAWLYRSVALVDASGKPYAFAQLRSAQEKAGNVTILDFLTA
jgi:hypothetical protein